MTTDVANTRYRDPATKRYNRRMIGAMLSYIVLLIGVQRAFDLDAMRGPARWVLADIMPNARPHIKVTGRLNTACPFVLWSPHAPAV